MKRMGVMLALAIISTCAARGQSTQLSSAQGASGTAPHTPAVSSLPASPQSPSLSPVAIPPPTLSANSSPDDVQVVLRYAVEALNKHDYTRTLELAKEVIAVNNGNALANNLAGASSLGLHDYSGAAAFFRRALEIQPAEPHSLGGLLEAYSLSGMTEQRDAVRSTLQQMARDGRLPAGFHYLFDTFDSNGKQIQVIEFPQLTGKYNYRYFFSVFDDQGKFLYRVALESDDIDQGILQARDPALAAKGRRFSLDGYKTDSEANYHFTYGFFDGEPSYEDVRKQVLEIVAGTRRAVTSSRHPLKQTPASAPGSSEGSQGPASTPATGPGTAAPAADQPRPAQAAQANHAWR